MFIYLIKNIINNKIYIGACSELYRRVKKHLDAVENNDERPLYQDMRLYGVDNFIFQIIEYCKNKKELWKREEYWVLFYKANRNRFKKLDNYNLTDGGKGCKGLKWPESSKQKRSEEYTGRKLTKEHCKNIGIASSKRRHSKESKLKISKSKYKIVLQFDLNGNLIKEYPSVKNAVEITKINGIDYACRNQKILKNYIWKYKNENN